MTDHKKLKEIEKCLNNLTVVSMTKEQLEKSIEEKSIIEIKSVIWEWYCFISDVCDILNE